MSQEKIENTVNNGCYFVKSKYLIDVEIMKMVIITS